MNKSYEMLIKKFDENLKRLSYIQTVKHTDSSFLRNQMMEYERDMSEVAKELKEFDFVSMERKLNELKEENPKLKKENEELSLNYLNLKKHVACVDTLNMNKEKYIISLHERISELERQVMELQGENFQKRSEMTKTVNDNSSDKHGSTFYESQLKNFVEDKETQPTPKDKVSRIHSILIKIIPSEDLLKHLQENVAHNVYDLIVNGDVTNDMLDQIENVITAWENKGKNIDKEFINQVIKSHFASNKKNRKQTELRTDRLDFDFKNKRYVCQDIPEAWKSTKEYFKDNLDANEKIVKLPDKITSY